MLIYLEEVFVVILTPLPSPNQSKKILLKNYWKKKSSSFVWSIKSLQRTTMQIEDQLLQNIPFNWKQAQKNNSLFGMENWLFKVFIEEVSKNNLWCQ